jgi:hypothetical protein
MYLAVLNPTIVNESYCFMFILFFKHFINIQLNAKDRTMSLEVLKYSNIDKRFYFSIEYKSTTKFFKLQGVIKVLPFNR